MCLEPLSPGILNNRTFDARKQFADLFTVLLHTRNLPDSNTPVVTASEQLVDSPANQLQALAQSHQQHLLALPRCSKYSRHVIGTDGAWMGFICRWEPNVRSSIHGHPSFAYYQALQGDFTMDLYDTSEESLAIHTVTEQLGAGHCIWKHGQSGCNDNFVHRISSCDRGGFTLHLFSDNPAIGKHYAAA